MKKIFVSAIGFITAFGMFAAALPAYAASATVSAPVTLTAQEITMLKQSLTILATIVSNLNARLAVEDGSMARSAEIKVTLQAIAADLSQINSILIALGPKSPATAMKPYQAPAKSAAPMPVSEGKLSPTVAEQVPQTSPVDMNMSGNAPAESAALPAPQTQNEQQVAAVSPLFTGRKILGIAIILLAVIGTIYFLRRQDTDEVVVAKESTSNTI